MGFLDNFFPSASGKPERNTFARDFEIVEVKDSKGRIRKKARYTGTWIVFRDPGAARKVMPCSLVLSALLAGLYIGTLLLKHLVSGQVIVMFPLLAGLMPLLYLLMGATSLPFRGKPMRQDQYMHSFIRISRSCTAVAACAVLTLVVTVGYRIYTGNWQFFEEDILFMILCAVIACLSIGLILLLRSVDFAEMPNSHVPYEQSIF